MSKSHVKAKDSSETPTWDRAIAEMLTTRIKRLKFAIRTYKEAKKRGEPWPGVSATQN